ELRQCHLLYLPLTFEAGEDSVEQLSTCFGIKCYEYILACRPVLVHCPPDFFTYRFFADSNAAVLAGEPKAEKLSEILDNFIANYDRVSIEVVRNALQLAEMFKGKLIAD